jgi:PAS domain S-box-containing protein
MANESGHLNDVLDSISSGLIAVDAGGAISFFNRAAAMMLGCESGEVLGKPYAELFAHETGLRKDCLYTLHTGHPLRSQEGTIHTRHGRVIPVRFSTMTVNSTEGEITGAIEIFEDLSGLKESEAQIEQSRTHAALGEMAANVAHQIRNPLGGIGGFAALLERDATLGETQRRLARKIIEGVATLDRIITELLMFTQPPTPYLQTISAQRALLEVVDSLKRRWLDLGLKIDCTLDVPDDPIFVQLDPQLFHELVWYLLEDAVAAMKRGGELFIRLSARRQSRRLLLDVQDPRRILKDEERSKLFFPFYTSPGSAGLPYIGSGLGLAMPIARRIVERHHGDIGVRSEASIGTVYHVELPALVDEKQNYNLCAKKEYSSSTTSR